MIRPHVGPLPHRAMSCGLLMLILIHSAGRISAWPYDHDNVARDLRPDPPAPMDAERVGEFIQPSSDGRNDVIKRTSSLQHRPTAYDILQHELWDKKMADEQSDSGLDAYEARKWSYLQDRLTDDYIKRAFSSLLDWSEDDVHQHGGQAEFGYGDSSIDIQRRSSLPETCGQRFAESSISKRVVLGREAGIGQWPWLVQLSEIDAKQPYCGGTLLNEEFVLTAAHCFDRHNPTDVVVILGDRDRLTKEGTEQRFRIDCVYIHEAYIPKGDYKDDIALIRLKTGRKRVKMGRAVQPACLPPRQRADQPDLFQTGDKCFVVGWGFTDPLTYFSSQHPAVLHDARLPILSPKSCRQAYGDLYTNKMICAGHMSGDHRTDACKGDSGGPLMCRHKDGQWVVWGIVSWGHNYFCNGSPDKPIPTVYTKVEKYLPWLKQRLRLDQC